MSKQERVYAYIGRFQIEHKAHVATMHYALDHSDHLIVLVGSAEVARDDHNPFTFEERKQVIEANCESMLADYRARGLSKKLSVLPVHDYVYCNNKWIQEVQEQVASVTTSSDITLTGCDKDSSTFYLKFFPHWKQDFFTLQEGISATGYREKYFGTPSVIDETLPEATKEFLSKFRRRHDGKTFAKLVAEFNFVPNYQKPFKDMPYGMVPFVTGDAVLVCAGHILLVERGGMPGIGTWALPGGFFQCGMDWSEEKGRFVPNGRPIDRDPVATVLRELREETNVRVPLPVLEGRIRETQVFCDPNRSRRWRIITHASYIQLNDTTLPEVRGDDDAAKAFWVPISEIKKNRSKFFEDHLSIIDAYLGIL